MFRALNCVTLITTKNEVRKLIQISGLKVPLNSTEHALKELIQKRLKLKGDFSYEVVKRSLDARRKDQIQYVYNVVLDVPSEAKFLTGRFKNVTPYTKPVYEIEKFSPNKKVAVIGYGPAGIFASLCLQEAGFDVTVFERGEAIEDRDESVNHFFETTELNEESNVQFGEGGAGTFSDGKLTNRSSNVRNIKLFTELVKHGAPEDIMYVSNPHVGTDILKNVVTGIRQTYKSIGGKIQFNQKMKELIIKDNIVVGIKADQDYYFDFVILAIGHSSRDTFRTLYAQGVEITQKDFAVGFRIEHPQVDINKAQFGAEYNNPRLGAAEYKLVNQTETRGVYTFCMCPGGIVIPAQSQKDTVVVNGMSYHARSLENANSAVLVTVNDKDFGDDVFSGVEFQEKIEALAYELGGNDYKAPVQTLKGFIENVVYPLGNVKPSYPIGYKNTNLRSIYSESINKAIIESLVAFDRKLKGFGVEDAILTGVESRSSSPIRIVRDKITMESNIQNLYPIGEGCGYAGGIVSAAIDGIKAYEKIRRKVESDEE